MAWACIAGGMNASPTPQSPRPSAFLLAEGHGPLASGRSCSPALSRRSATWCRLGNRKVIERGRPVFTQARP